MKSLLTLIIAALPILSFAQNKIGYTNVNAVLSVMPESKAMNQDLQTYSLGLQKRMEDMNNQLNYLYSEYQKKTKSPDTSGLGTLTANITKLDADVKATQQVSERQLSEKRQELLSPIVDKVELALDAVKEKGGYDFILNSVDGSGTSVILRGPTSNDITNALLKELGIELKQQQPAAAPSKGSKKDKKK
ncbi:MAG: outer membrane protein [Granulosicoccus sp.]|jgi:outer membrane protein